MNSLTPQYVPTDAAGNRVDDTGRDWSSYNVFADGNGLIVQFYYEKVRVESKSDPSQNGRIITRLCVAKAIRGDRRTVSNRVIGDTADPETERRAARMFPREFAAFQNNEEIPTDGTALHELPGMTQSMISMLVLNGIRSVEDLLELDDTILTTVHFDAIHAKRLAERWMAAKKDNASLLSAAEVEAKMAAALDDANRRNTEQAEALKRLTAQVEALTRAQAGAGGGAAAAPGSTGQQAAAIPVDVDEDLPPPSGIDPFMDGPAVINNNDGEGIDPLAE